MASYNRVILMGNLTRDPQLRYLPSNTPVVDLGMAVNRRYRGQDGEMKEEVCFVDVSAFGKQAETLNQYMRKGRALLIEGRLHFRQWTTDDGQRRSKLSVVAERFQFVGGRGEGERSEAQPAAASAPDTTGGASAPPPYDDAEPPTGDDIPF